MTTIGNHEHQRYRFTRWATRLHDTPRLTYQTSAPPRVPTPEELAYYFDEGLLTERERARLEALRPRQ